MTQPSPTALPVRITSLSKHYGSLRAVDDVTFDIKAGEFLTLLGPSGSGKTTLLMMIAGFARPTAGSISIADQEIIHLPPHRRNIGMVFQNYALFPHMSVGENIAYPLRLRKVANAEATEKVRRVLDLVRLDGYQDRRVSQLSGGQRQRIALARAIVFEPRILLMDEPLSALDKQLRETMQIELRELHNRLGMTTISVTHDQREALTMSDRVAVFSRGCLAQIATPADLYEKPESRFIAEFIGESNFLPLRRVGDQLQYGDMPLVFASQVVPADGDLLLMLRPESVHLDDEGAATSTTANRFRGTVVAAIYQGESLLLQIRLDGGHAVQVRLANRSENLRRLPTVGQPVSVRIDREDARVVRAEMAP